MQVNFTQTYHQPYSAVGYSPLLYTLAISKGWFTGLVHSITMYSTPCGYHKVVKIENLQFTQYSIIMLLSSMLLTAQLQLTIIRLHVAIHEESADNHTL